MTSFAAQQLPGAAHARVRRGRAFCRAAFLPPAFARLFMGDPPGRADSMLTLLEKHRGKWEVRKPKPGTVDIAGAHSSRAGELPPAHIRRHFRVAEHGKAVMKALQVEMYTEGEQARWGVRLGCQVRRESQEKLALCCHGVTALLNESHHELVIDVPLPPETASAEEYRALDKMLCGLDARVHAALSSKA